MHEGEEIGWKGALGPRHRALSVILRNHNMWELKGPLVWTSSYRKLGFVDLLKLMWDVFMPSRSKRLPRLGQDRTQEESHELTRNEIK